MGAEPYSYKVPYEPDPNAALQKLRAEVFASGKYHGAENNPATPEEALELAAEDGTRSILDIREVVDAFPEDGMPAFFAAVHVSEEDCSRYFGTTRPRMEDVMGPDMDDAAVEFWENVERGEARVITLYEDGGDTPTHYYFEGYSFD